MIFYQSTGVNLKFEFELSSSMEDVWKTLTNSTGLTKWFCEEANINLKKNGRFFVKLDQEGVHNTKGCRIITVEPFSVISFFWKGHPETFEFMNWDDSLTTVSINLSGSNPTRIILEHSGWKSSEDWQQAKKYHENVFWPEKIKNLTALFN